jgi:ATP-binding cassette subfamily B protein
VTTISASSEFTIPPRFNSDRRSPLRWLLRHTARYWYLVIVMLTGAVSNAALAAVVPILTGAAFAVLLADPGNLAEVLRLAVIIGASQVVRGVLQLGRNFSAELIGQKLERDIRHELYTSLLGKSMTFHSLQPVGDTMARATNDVREINLMFSPGINLVVGSANFLILPLIAAPRYHPSLVLVPALFIIGYAVALWFYLKELDPITADVRETFGQLNSRLSETLDGIEIVKGMAQEEFEVGRFLQRAAAYRDAFLRQGQVEARFIPLLLLGLAEASSLLHALILFQLGLIDAGAVVAYFGLIQLFGFPTFVSLFSYSQVSLGFAGARRILDLINRETDLDQNLGGYAQPMRGEIEFRKVSFAYGAGEPALADISFKAKPGQTVAIVGQTGSGKTTLVKLVNRTYDVTSGEILVDGIPVTAWNLAALRRGISMIEQDIFLFSRSIQDNIAFGSPQASLEQIETAARTAQADDFIQGFEESYQTVIGERGVTLSGGQRQRLALARAFLTDPPILILDDSTSAIDSATEDRIQRAIYTAARGRTTLIITHRLSQIRWADLILVLRQGRHVASGSHEELMRSSEAYRKIFAQ